MSPNYNLRRFASLSFGILIATVAVGCQSTGNPMGMFGAAQQEQFRNPTKTHLAFAKLSEKTGDVQAARNSYQKVLEENPQSVAATIGMAGLELRCGRSDAAEREFLKASSLSPGDPLVTEALGQFYLSEHRYDEAEHYLTEGLQASPGNLHLQYRLGVALAHQGRLDEAAGLFAQSVGEAEADYNIGLILYEQGNMQVAEQHLLRAVMKKPDLVRAQDWLDVIRKERTQAQLAKNQDVARPRLPHGAVSQVSRSELADQAALGSLPLDARQAMARQQAAQRPVPENTVVNAPTTTPSPSQLPYQAPGGQYPTLDTARLTNTQYEQLSNSRMQQQMPESPPRR